VNGGPILEDAVTPFIILNHILPGPPSIHLTISFMQSSFRALGFTQTPGLLVLCLAGAVAGSGRDVLNKIWWADYRGIGNSGIYYEFKRNVFE